MRLVSEGRVSLAAVPPHTHTPPTPSPVVGPTEARRVAGVEAGSASISCEFSIAAFATPERRVRRAGDRRTAEAAATIQQCFESVVQRHLYPRSDIAIYVQVLQSDGGALSGRFGGAMVSNSLRRPTYLCTPL